MTFACTTRYCMNLFNDTDWFKTHINGWAKWQSDATDLFCWDLSVAARSHFSLPIASTFMLEQMLIAKWVSCFGNVLRFTYILHHSFLNHLWFSPSSFLNMRSFSPKQNWTMIIFQKTWVLFFKWMIQFQRLFLWSTSGFGSGSIIDPFFGGSRRWRPRRPKSWWKRRPTVRCGKSDRECR